MNATAFAEHGLSYAAAERVARRIAGAGATIVRVEISQVMHRVIRMTTQAVLRVRLHVQADGRGRARAHDVIVKRLRANAPPAAAHLARFAPSGDPRHPNYWPREVAAYAWPPLRDLPSPLRLANCYEAEQSSDEATLWLEAVVAEPPAIWSEARFAAVARALGAWQGSRRDPSRDPPWFAHGALRMWAPGLGSSAHVACERDEVFAEAAVIRELGRGARDAMRGVWAGRDADLALLDAVPQTFIHGDCWTRNLLGEPASDAVVAIDWSELGIGPVAHDLVNLVLDSVWMLDVPPERLAQIEGIALHAYLDGWRAVRGPCGPDTIVRAYRANARLRFATLAGLLARQAADPERRRDIAERYGRSFDDVFRARCAVVRAALREGVRLAPVKS